MWLPKSLWPRAMDTGKSMLAAMMIGSNSSARVWRTQQKTAKTNNSLDQAEKQEKQQRKVRPPKPKAQPRAVVSVTQKTGRVAWPPGRKKNAKPCRKK